MQLLSSGSVSGSAGSCLNDQGHIGEMRGPMDGLLRYPEEEEVVVPAVETVEETTEDVNDSNESPLQMLLDEDDDGEEDC